MNKYTDEQKKKNMLAKLVMRGNVGGNYTPREKVSSGIPKHERGNLESLLDELHKDGFIEYHKGKKCVSINRHTRRTWSRNTFRRRFRSSTGTTGNYGRTRSVSEGLPSAFLLICNYGLFIKREYRETLQEFCFIMAS